MVAGDRQDRRGIVAIRFVKLVVIILRLPEAINDVTDVKEEHGSMYGRAKIDLLQARLIGAT